MYIDGKYFSKGFQDFEIMASVQPRHNKIVQEVIGERTTDEINIYTFSLLLKRDIIFYNNHEYEIHDVRSWINHTHAIARRIDIK